MNQKGLSPLILLFIVVLGVFIMWELNEFIDLYSTTGKGQIQTAGPGTPVCLSGEPGNCNDTDDVFILN